MSCWGLNITGQLGDGTRTDGITPVAVSGIEDAIAIVAGGLHTCAAHRGGQLGDGTNLERLAPAPTMGVDMVTEVSAATFSTCALRSAGDVACWGNNSFGQIGNGGMESVNVTPLSVLGLTDATAIASGGAHTCAIRSGGQLLCWGLNDAGQLGVGGPFWGSYPVLGL